MSLQRIQSFSFLKSCRYSFSLLSLPRCIRRNLASSGVLFQDVISDGRFLCDSIEFPGQTLSTTDYRIPGSKKIKVPFLREYSEINATFYYPSQIPMYEFFYEWIATTSFRNTKNEYFDDITCQARIIQFKEGNEFSGNTINEIVDNQPVQMKVNLKNLYPLSVTSLSSNWGDDNFHKISVSFFFEDMEIKDFEYIEAEDRQANTSVIVGEIPIKPPTIDNFNISVPQIKI